MRIYSSRPGTEQAITSAFRLAHQNRTVRFRPDPAMPIDGTPFAYDIVAEVVRLCAMNLYLHGIGGATSPVTQKDALLDRGDRAFDVILTNPPFRQAPILPHCP